MADTLTLADPLPPPTTFRVARILFDITDSTIQIVVREAAGGAVLPDGKVYECGYTGTAAKDLMQTLNTSNNTTVSMQKKILNKLCLDGQLPAGTVD
jgi:hypothetical protein